MTARSFAYYFAYVLASPISGLVVGASLNQAYGSKVSRSSRWDTHAVALLCLMFIAVILREICTAIERESEPFVEFLEHPTPSQVLAPITIGCVEFLVQLYLIKLLYRRFGKSALVILSMSICCINFLISWGCALNILLTLIDPNKAQVNPTKNNLPTLNIGIQIFTAWMGSSTFAGLVIFGSQLYSNRQARILGQDLIIQFFRNDNTITRIGVITLQTAAMNAVLILVISLYFLINEITGDNPTPVTSGCFVFLNLMRVPVSCATLGFTMKRQEKLDADSIGIPLPSSVNMNSMDDLSFKENKNNIFKNQVTVHTVRSEVYEN